MRNAHGRTVGWCRHFLVASWVAGLALCGTAGEETPSAKRIRSAVQSGLRLIETSAATYPEHRTCFSCHHQTLPMQAMDTARRRGFKIDSSLLKAQAKLTRDTFESKMEQLKAGKGIGGGAMTVSFGLWALNLGDDTRDETTTEMVQFLLKTQEKDGHYKSNLDRPPLEDSQATSTVIAAYYMKTFAGKEQKADVDRAVSAAAKWLAKAERRSQEDRNSRLWGLALLGGEKADLTRARAEVLEGQRSDGGWAQLPHMDSDAYATGQTLFVLHEAGMPVSDPAYQRGLRYLLRTQLDDGSWHVKTRSKPIQVFFDSGFPHGKDQFISVSATCWAVVALAEGVAGSR